MRIPHVVVAAATMAGRGQVFWGPRRAGVALAGMAQLARWSLTGARADRSRYQPRFDGHVLRALARGLTASVRLHQAFWHARPGFCAAARTVPNTPIASWRRSTPWAGCGGDR